MMLYRYKVDNDMPWGIYEVTIQKYCPTRPLIKWHKMTKIPLRKMVRELHLDKFSLYEWYDINDTMLYETLKEYKTIDELVVKYIMKKRKQQIKHNNTKDWIDAFVLTNGWNTIEVKENEE